MILKLFILTSKKEHMKQFCLHHIIFAEIFHMRLEASHEKSQQKYFDVNKTDLCALSQRP